MKNYSWLILTCVITAILFLSCPAEQKAPLAVLVPDDFAGMCHAGYSSNLDREFNMLDEMGVVWVHWDFSWSSIQPENAAQWNFDGSIGNRTDFDARVKRSNDEGKKIMGMLLYDVGWIHNGNCAPAPAYAGSMRQICNEEEIGLFVEYAKKTVQRYNGKPGSEGKVDAWFIWNEPNLQPRFWTGTQEQFYALNKAVAKAIRELDAKENTHTVLIGGVFASTEYEGWVDGLFKHGGMKEYKIDGISIHPYHAVPVGSASMFNHFKKLVSRHGYAEKIWVNEMGYPTYSDINFNFSLYPGRYKSDQYEGDMPEIVTKTFTLLAAAGAKTLTWYHMFDSGNRNDNNSENWFGLVWRKTNEGINEEDWERKGGYWGYALCANNIPGKTYREKKFFSDSVPKDIESHYFGGSDGKHVLVVWNTSLLRNADVTIALKGSNHKRWDTVSGLSQDIAATSTHKLDMAGKNKKTLAFITWEE